MSNTFKDKPRKFRFPRTYEDKYISVPYIRVYTDRLGEKREYSTSYRLQTEAGPKVKKLVHNEDGWMQSTPSWFINVYMNRPKRRKGQQWEQKMKTMEFDQLDLHEAPDVSKKPHIYYW